MSDRLRRPAREYIAATDAPVVIVPAWAADWLERQTNLPQRRAALRGADAAVDEVLLAIRQLAMGWRASSDPSTDLGTTAAVSAEPAPRSSLGVNEAAGLIGITDRAVRKAISEQRLAAQRIDGRWLVDRADALNYPRRTA